MAMNLFNTMYFSLGAYSLSILDEDLASRAKVIKHYRIRDLDNGGCYITTKQKCSSLADLVKYYSGEICLSGFTLD